MKHRRHLLLYVTLVLSQVHLLLSAEANQSEASATCWNAQTMDLYKNGQRLLYATNGGTFSISHDHVTITDTSVLAFGCCAKMSLAQGSPVTYGMIFSSVFKRVLVTDNDWRCIHSDTWVADFYSTTINDTLWPEAYVIESNDANDHLEFNYPHDQRFEPYAKWIWAPMSTGDLPPIGRSSPSQNCAFCRANSIAKYQDQPVIRIMVLFKSSVELETKPQLIYGMDLNSFNFSLELYTSSAPGVDVETDPVGCVSGGKLIFIPCHNTTSGKQIVAHLGINGTKSSELRICNAEDTNRCKVLATSATNPLRCRQYQYFWAHISPAKTVEIGLGRNFGKKVLLSSALDEESVCSHITHLQLIHENPTNPIYMRVHRNSSRDDDRILGDNECLVLPEEFHSRTRCGDGYISSPEECHRCHCCYMWEDVDSDNDSAIVCYVPMTSVKLQGKAATMAHKRHDEVFCMREFPAIIGNINFTVSQDEITANTQLTFFIWLQNVVNSMNITLDFGDEEISSDVSLTRRNNHDDELYYFATVTHLYTCPSDRQLEPSLEIRGGHHPTDVVTATVTLTVVENNCLVFCNSNSSLKNISFAIFANVAHSQLNITFDFGDGNTQEDVRAADVAKDLPDWAEECQLLGHRVGMIHHIYRSIGAFDLKASITVCSTLPCSYRKSITVGTFDDFQDFVGYRKLQVSPLGQHSPSDANATMSFVMSTERFDPGLMVGIDFGDGCNISDVPPNQEMVWPNWTIPLRTRGQYLSSVNHSYKLNAISNHTATMRVEHRREPSWLLLDNYTVMLTDVSISTTTEDIPTTGVRQTEGTSAVYYKPPRGVRSTSSATTLPSMSSGEAPSVSATIATSNKVATSFSVVPTTATIATIATAILTKATAAATSTTSATITTSKSTTAVIKTETAKATRAKTTWTTSNVAAKATTAVSLTTTANLKTTQQSSLEEDARTTWTLPSATSGVDSMTTLLQNMSSDKQTTGLFNKRSLGKIFVIKSASRSVYPLESITFAVPAELGSSASIEFGDETSPVKMELQNEANLSALTGLPHELGSRPLLLASHRYNSSGLFHVKAKVSGQNGRKQFTSSRRLYVRKYSAQILVDESEKHLEDGSVDFVILLADGRPRNKTLQVYFGDGSAPENLVLQKFESVRFPDWLALKSRKMRHNKLAAVVSHKYTEPGLHRARLILTDDSDAGKDSLQSVIVEELVQIANLQDALDTLEVDFHADENNTGFLLLWTMYPVGSANVHWVFGNTTLTIDVVIEKVDALPSWASKDDATNQPVTHERFSANCNNLTTCYAGVVTKSFENSIPPDASVTVRATRGKRAASISKLIVMNNSTRDLNFVVNSIGTEVNNTVYYRSDQDIVLRAEYPKEVRNDALVSAKCTVTGRLEICVTKISQDGSRKSLELQIPASTLHPGTHALDIQGEFVDTYGIRKTVTAKVLIVISPVLLVASLQATKQIYTVNETLLLDAGNSVDPDSNNSVEGYEFQWSCFKSQIPFVPFKAPSQQQHGLEECLASRSPLLLSSTQPLLSLPISSLDLTHFPATFHFRVLVSKSGMQEANGSASVTINVISGAEPSLSIVCLENCDAFVSYDSALLLTFNCSNCGDDEQLAKRWTFGSDKDYGDPLEAFPLGSNETLFQVEAFALRLLYTETEVVTLTVTRVDKTFGSAFLVLLLPLGSTNDSEASGAPQVGAASSREEGSVSKSGVDLRYLAFLTLLVPTIAFGIWLRNRHRNKVAPRDERYLASQDQSQQQQPTQPPAPDLKR